MKGIPSCRKCPFNTFGSVIDAELELDEEELLVETLRTFIVATSSETIMIEVKSFWTILIKHASLVYQAWRCLH